MNSMLLIYLVITVISVTGFVFIFWRAGYWNKLLVKLSIVEEHTAVNDAVNSWRTCLEQLDVHADIVFLGDSITRNGDFRSFFPTKRICNLGCAGDSILNIADRVSMIPTVQPRTVIVMGGINSLASRTLKQSLRHYERLLENLSKNQPCKQVIILSVLPVSADSHFCNNKKIVAFNAAIKGMAEAKKYIYIDLFSQYAKDGSLPAEYSEDGLHLKPDCYTIWANAVSQYIGSDRAGAGTSP